MSAAQLLGVLTATALVLAAAIWARGASQEPGNHRPGQRQPAPLTATAPEAGALPFVPGPDYRDEPDDWTADLPTEAFPAVVEPSPAARAGLQLLELYPARHTSPSETAAETARRRWGMETPIFAALATEHGYHPIHRFDRRAAA